jgi:hypothetical protein
MTTARQPPAKGKTMEALLTLVPSPRKTRVLLTSGKDVLLRGKLPPLNKLFHERAVVTLLEALSLWVDGRLCVALYADERVDCFRLGLTDELGVGARSVFYAVEVLARSHRGRREGGDDAVVTEMQLPLIAKPGGAQ